MRVGWNTLNLITAKGKSFDLIDYLQSLPAGMKLHQVKLGAAVGRDKPAMAVAPDRLTKDSQGTEANQLTLRRAAVRKGRKLDTRSLVAAEFMILGTSLPSKGYGATAIMAVYRLRWQIELAFKRFKSLLHVDQLPTRTERGSRSWLYAHLILALLCDDPIQDFLEASP